MKPIKPLSCPVSWGVTGSYVDYTGTSTSNANMEHSDSQGSNDTIKITPQFAHHFKPKVNHFLILLHFDQNHWNCICNSRSSWSYKRKQASIVKIFFCSFRETHWGLCLCPGGAVLRACLHEHSAWHHLTAKEWVLTCQSWSPRCHLHLQVMPDITQHKTTHKSRAEEAKSRQNWHALFCQIF